MGRRSKDEVYSVTTAPANPAAERDERSRKYLIAMSVRILCFFLIFVVHGWLRWAVVAMMMVLPYVAVVIANAGRETDRPERPAPVPPIARPAVEGRTDALGPGPTLP